MAQLSVNVRFRYPSGFAMDIAFAAQNGVTALCGPSGGGKSTVLLLIAGVLQPSDGYIRLGDRALVDTSAKVALPPEQRHVGIVFQDYLLFPHMTVRNNLLFGARRNNGRRISLEKVVEVLELGDLLNRYPAALSGGQRQRVAIGRAIVRGPEFLLLDEPVAALDHDLKSRVLVYLDRLFQEWCIPILFVCHERRDVTRLAHQSITIHSGRVTEVEMLKGTEAQQTDESSTCGSERFGNENGSG
jgi:molybdate transport system ATP-binding protein